MSWLKRVGSIALQIGKVAPVVGPIVAAVIPGTKDDVIVARVVPTLDQIAAIVVQAEAMGQAIAAPGAAKLQMATPLIAAQLTHWLAVSGHEIADPALFQVGCTKVAGGMADCLNALKP